MADFKSRSIAKKAITLGMVPALCVLLLVSAAYVIAAFVLAQRSLARDMDALAAIVRDNVSASLAFDDRRTAGDVLGALHAKQNVNGVCVFDGRGELFASYEAGGFTCAPTALEAEAITTGRLIRVAPVTVGTRRLGLVQLIGNANDLYDWLLIQGLVTAGALAFGSLMVLVLVRRMQGAISQPVLDLAAAAREVTATGDYTIRARKTSEDEVGSVADAFNAMLEQIQNHSRLKDEFLAALSHELRTPLNAILGWLQIIRTTKPEGERLERALTGLDRNARAQARLVEDLLDVSRIVTGKLQLTREAVDLRDVLAAALEGVQPLLSQSSLRLTTNVPQGPRLVSGDRDRLRQVVANLLSNAIKFTPPGGAVSLDLRDEDENYAVSVVDTGIGITAEFLPYVFDRFRQSDGSTTREHGGLGLGLAIVKEIVELHGGTVTASSKGRGKGARFTVHFPQLLRAGPPVTESPPVSGSEPVARMQPAGSPPAPR